jgi:hypothetical protein
MDDLERRIVGMFDYWGKEELDLHELFEAGGNDTQLRVAVFDAVEKLVRDGLLAERGNDFYALTEQGRAAAGSSPAIESMTENE